MKYRVMFHMQGNNNIPDEYGEYDFTMEDSSYPIPNEGESVQYSVKNASGDMETVNRKVQSRHYSYDLGVDYCVITIVVEPLLLEELKSRKYIGKSVS